MSPTDPLPAGTEELRHAVATAIASAGFPGLDATTADRGGVVWADRLAVAVLRVLPDQALTVIARSHGSAQALVVTPPEQLCAERTWCVEVGREEGARSMAWPDPRTAFLLARRTQYGVPAPQPATSAVPSLRGALEQALVQLASREQLPALQRRLADAIRVLQTPATGARSTGLGKGLAQLFSLGASRLDGSHAEALRNALADGQHLVSKQKQGGDLHRVLEVAMEALAAGAGVRAPKEAQLGRVAAATGGGTGRQE